jgi:hypothetical protein
MGLALGVGLSFSGPCHIARRRRAMGEEMGEEEEGEEVYKFHRLLRRRTSSVLQSCFS